MNEILISINPMYVERIMNNSKKYEFRKVLAKEVNILVIYSTSPVMTIIGEAEVEGTIEMSPSALWEKTKSNAGISS